MTWTLETLDQELDRVGLVIADALLPRDRTVRLLCPCCNQQLITWGPGPADAYRRWRLTGLINPVELYVGIGS